MLLWEIEKGLQKKSCKNDQQIVQFLPCLRGYCCFPISFLPAKYFVLYVF